MAMTIFTLSNFFSSLVPAKSTPSPLAPAPPPSLFLSIQTSLQPPRTRAPGLAYRVTTCTWVPKTSTDGDITSIVWPSLAHANILNFFNVQIKVDDDEPEERILNRFRRSVLRAGILQESKRRRYFESNQDKRKRKARAAAQRNRKRRSQPKALAKPEAPKKNKDDEEDDNWEVPEGDIPYCNF